MIPILAGLVFAGATLQQGRQRDTLKSIVNDHEVTAPYVLVTATGRRRRAYGQDFVNPNEWRPRDALEICAGSDSVSLRVRNLRRGEDLVTETDRLTAATLPLQIMNGPGFRALLGPRRISRRAEMSCRSGHPGFALQATVRLGSYAALVGLGVSVVASALAIASLGGNR